MNFNGHFRSEASNFSSLGLGSGSNAVKQYILARAMLQPNVVIDDHFSLKSQWSLLSSPNFTPVTSNGLWSGQGGYVFGDPSATYLTLNRAYLEWASDFGVLRMGRVPVSWGYGVVYDSGDQVWDDFQSALDRVEYRLHLGHIIGGVAYSKGRKLSTLGNTSDQEFYTFYFQYDNPEAEVDAGIMYEKQARATAQSADLTGSANTGNPFNPYHMPTATSPAGADQPAYPLATKTPYPLSNNFLDLYIKKTAGYFTFGGEIAWLSGDAVDYDGDGANGGTDTLNAYAALLTASYEYHKVKAFIEFLYASGDDDLNGDHLNGFVVLNRNRGRSLILGKELLGLYHGPFVGYGSLMVYGNNDTVSGVYYLRPGFRVDWDESWSTGVEAMIARKAVVAPGDNANLGVELDLGVTYGVYRNFDLGANVALLFPGLGLRVADPKTAFALRTTAVIKF